MGAIVIAPPWVRLSSPLLSRARNSRRIVDADTSNRRARSSTPTRPARSSSWRICCERSSLLPASVGIVVPQTTAFVAQHGILREPSQDAILCHLQLLMSPPAGYHPQCGPEMALRFQFLALSGPPS